MDYGKLAELLFPHITTTARQYREEIYPRRDLPEGAMVTRFAPSPTGFLHIGGVFTSLVNERCAHQSGGVFLLRIEDTDKKREQQDGISAILDGLESFGIHFDEGVNKNGESGAYGPYTQSQRGVIYQAFCKELVEKGLAYPCFCSEEELADIRRQQEADKAMPGYHGAYARCRDLSYEEIERRVQAGESYVMRLRSPGRPGGRIKYKDVIKGQIEMDENIVDIVLLKSDGIPTYHFAHAVDDSLMGTTHVIRGDEWVSSVNIHLQLFQVLGMKPPKYAHVAPVMKEEDGSKRKLSKRKDPEAAVSYFTQEGYPKESVLEYLLTLANSTYEDWRWANREQPYTAYPFQLGKMGQSGALFDLQKLHSVSAEVISRMTAAQVAAGALDWAGEFDPELHRCLAADRDYTEGLFAIDRGGKKPRKDIAKWSDVRGYCAYFFDELFRRDEALEMDAGLQKQVLARYLEVYDEADDKDAWFGRMKEICPDLGFAPEVKLFKAAEPGTYKGHVGDVSAVVRMAVTGRHNTPDLHAVMALLGGQRCRARIAAYMEQL